MLVAALTLVAKLLINKTTAITQTQLMATSLPLMLFQLSIIMVANGTIIK